MGYENGQFGKTDGGALVAVHELHSTVHMTAISL